MRIKQIVPFPLRGADLDARRAHAAIGVARPDTVVDTVPVRNSFATNVARVGTSYYEWSLLEMYVLEAIPTKAVMAPIASANAAGLHIIQGFEWDAGLPPAEEREVGVDAHVSYDYTTMAKGMAHFTIADSGGKANVVIVTSSDIPTSAIQTDAMKDEFRRLCADCQVQTVDAPQTQPASRLTTLTRTLVNKDREIDYMIPVFDVTNIDEVDLGAEQSTWFGPPTFKEQYQKAWGLD